MPAVIPGPTRLATGGDPVANKKRWWQLTYREILANEGRAWLNEPPVARLVERGVRTHKKLLRDAALAEQGIDPRRDQGVNSAPRDLEQADVDEWLDAARGAADDRARDRRWKKWLT